MTAAFEAWSFHKATWNFLTKGCLAEEMTFISYSQNPHSEEKIPAISFNICMTKQCINLSNYLLNHLQIYDYSLVLSCRADMVCKVEEYQYTM